MVIHISATWKRIVSSHVSSPNGDDPRHLCWTAGTRLATPTPQHLCWTGSPPVTPPPRPYTTPTAVTVSSKSKYKAPMYSTVQYTPTTGTKKDNY